MATIEIINPPSGEGGASVAVEINGSEKQISINWSAGSTKVHQQAKYI